MRKMGAFISVAILLLASVVLAVDTGSVANTASSNVFNNAKYTITLRDAELKEALRFLATVDGMNIIIPEDLTGVVNVSFDDVTIMDAMNSIIKANSLDFAVERDVMRIGKAGQFSLTGEDLQTETIRLKFATAKDLVDKIKVLLTDRGSVLADERTNSVVVREKQTNLDNVKRFVNDVDIRDTQILIEARIVEATRDFSRNLGVQWGVNQSGNRVNVTGVSAVGKADNDSLLNVNLPAQNPTSGLGLLIGTLTGGTNIDIQLTAAEQKGDARVISEPSIVTSNGVTAKIRSGETLLIKTTGDMNIGSAVVPGDTGLHEVETGVELDVTPQISGGSLVKLKIAAETSQPDFSREVEGIPVIVDNTASTEVMVLDGQTTVIGGLIKFTGSDTVKKVPFLADIPVLGNMFKSRAKAKRNTELMIFIRPSVIVPVDQIIEGNAEYEVASELKAESYVTPLDAKKEKKKLQELPDTREPFQQQNNRRNPHLTRRYE